LYNPGGVAYSLDGHFLSDKSTDLTRWAIPAGASVPAGGYAIIHFSGQNQLSGGEIHTDFGLTQCKNEWIILSDATGVVVDSLNIQQLTYSDNSVSRTTDGAATWGICQGVTYNAANSLVIDWYSGTPTFSVAPGFYTSTQTVSLSTTDAGATIYYTLDGTDPDLLSAVYATALTISATTVVRAFANNPDPNIPESFIETNTYFINENHTIPVMSVCGELVTDFLNNVAAGAFSSNFDGHFEFFEKDGTLADEGSGYYNKHGNDSWAYAQRGFDFVMRDQYGINHKVMHQVFPQKNRSKYKRLILKAAANDNYSFSGGAHLRDALIHTVSQLGDMRMDERSSRFVVVYVDGVYWGLYDCREKVDDADFTDYYYNQPEDQIEFLKTWGGTWEEYGTNGLAEWGALTTYILGNDMTVTANYEYVKSVYNVGSLIDYVVLNSVVVTSDWLNWNTGWWHGNVPEPIGDKQKWRYILWDNDASWGHYINYTGIPSTAADADPCNPESLPDPGGQGHIPILNKLYTNPEFKQQYITRYIDLFNGILGCPELQAILDSFVVVMTPEMAGQTTTWGGTVPGWNTNVTTLKTYIDDRCAAIGEGLKDCYDLTGPFNLTVQVDPPGAGQVKVNSIWVSPYPWTGVFYGGIATNFKANDFSGFDFDYWESQNHNFTQPDSISDTLDLTMDDVVTAHFTEVGVPGVPPPATYTGFHLPNAFSPNGDNNNDWLQYFAGYDVESFDLKIFDRWGNMVFQTQSNGNYWDGYYKGKLLNSGIYTYTLDYTLTDIGAQEQTGNITLIR
ncbi:CotH kinase family protein, partial [Crocinitomix catalasitica]|nr:CotH kinase family protein [Crocinitomix catalasitica]